MQSPSRIEELRELIRHTERPKKRSSLAAQGLEHGLPLGILAECTGSAKIEWLMHILANHADARAAWLEPRLTLFPTAVAQRRVGLHRLLLIETERDYAWSVIETLKSGLFHLVIVPSIDPTDREYKRLQLCAEKSGATLVLLNEKPRLHWSVSVGVEARLTRGRSLDVTLLRERGV